MNIAKDTTQHMAALIHTLKESAWLILTVIISLGPILAENETVGKICAGFGVSVVGIKFGIDFCRKIYSTFKVKTQLDKVQYDTTDPIQSLVNGLQPEIQKTPDDVFTKLGIDPETFLTQLQSVAGYIEATKQPELQSGVITNITPPDQAADSTNAPVDPSFVYPTVQ